MRCSCRWQCSSTFCSTCRCHSTRNAPNSRNCNQFRRSSIGRPCSCLMHSFMPFTRTSCTPFTFGRTRIMCSLRRNTVSCVPSSFLSLANISSLRSDVLRHLSAIRSRLPSNHLHGQPDVPHHVQYLFIPDLCVCDIL